MLIRVEVEAVSKDSLFKNFYYEEDSGVGKITLERNLGLRIKVLGLIVVFFLLW